MPLVDEVEQRLAQLAFVGEQVREAVRHLGSELDAGLLGARRQHGEANVHERLDLHRLLHQLDLSGLRLREIRMSLMSSRR